MRKALIALVTALVLAGTASALTPPPAGIKSFAELTPPAGSKSLPDLPPPTAPYNETADANAAVQAAFDRAKKSHKRVLIDLGGNWCVDCVVLANFLKLPEMPRFMTAHYEVVPVDV